MPQGKYFKVPVALSCLAACMIAVPASAGVSACANIPNVANLTFGESGATQTIASNVAAFRTAKLLDLRLTSTSDTAAVGQGATGAIPFALTNSGNGDEAFVLDASIDGSDAAITGFAIDSDGNGRFDAKIDTVVASSRITSLIAPGATAQLLVLVKGGVSFAAGTLTLAARAQTGSGAPGTGFAGENGCEAVVGTTGAAATTSVKLTAAPGADLSQISVIKSQSVVAPNGSALPVMGAIVTYTIETRFAGRDVIRAAHVADAIPAGATYVPGSIRIDGTTLSDSEDADAGSFDGDAIQVALGDVAGPAVHSIQFQVKIQ